MSDDVIWELQFLAVIVTLGVVLAFGYDFIRIFRRVIPHGVIWIAIEDILFWACCGIITFVVSFWENDGRLRWYTIVGVALGAYLYHNTLSNFWVNLISAILRLPVNCLKKALKKFKVSYKILAEKKGETCGGSKTKKEESV